MICAILAGDPSSPVALPSGIISVEDFFIIYSSVSMYCSERRRFRALTPSSSSFELLSANEILFRASQRDIASYKIAAA